MILAPLVFPGKSDKLTNSNLLQTLVNCGRKKVVGSSPASLAGQGDRKLQKITENYADEFPHHCLMIFNHTHINLFLRVAIIKI